mmetsp:Transcript_24769/g.68497  ORF Transcript_24769/g.68497 Transcript_24769/m.68497 type:complete len:279 (-) Transcript_24769:1104-1940(-)
MSCGPPRSPDRNWPFCQAPPSFESISIPYLRRNTLACPASDSNDPISVGTPKRKATTCPSSKETRSITCPVLVTFPHAKSVTVHLDSLHCNLKTGLDFRVLHTVTKPFLSPKASKVAYSGSSSSSSGSSSDTLLLPVLAFAETSSHCLATRLTTMGCLWPTSVAAPGVLLLLVVGSAATAHPSRAIVEATCLFFTTEFVEHMNEPSVDQLIRRNSDWDDNDNASSPPLHLRKMPLDESIRFSSPQSSCARHISTAGSSPELAKYEPAGSNVTPFTVLV